MRKLLSAKIHRATVTEANVDYEGSLTIPPELLKAAGIVPYESVCVWNVTRGTRLETYAITGLPGSSDICANGAAAHLIQPGDRVIIATYAFVAADSIDEHLPRLIFVDDHNQITHSGPEVAGPQRREDDKHTHCRGDKSRPAAGAAPMVEVAKDFNAESSGDSSGRQTS